MSYLNLVRKSKRHGVVLRLVWAHLHSRSAVMIVVGLFANDQWLANQWLANHELDKRIDFSLVCCGMMAGSPRTKICPPRCSCTSQRRWNTETCVKASPFTSPILSSHTSTNLLLLLPKPHPTKRPITRIAGTALLHCNFVAFICIKAYHCACISPAISSAHLIIHGL